MYSQLTTVSLSTCRGFGVQRLKLAPQVREVRLGVQRTTDRALEELGRLEGPAPAMDLLAEPLAQIVELPSLELCVEVAELGDRSFPELDRDDVPERVGREVPEARARPVDVL